jgi:S-phase kinase-associated protein 1
MAKVKLISNSGNEHLCNLKAVIKMSKTIKDMMENMIKNCDFDDSKIDLKPISLTNSGLNDRALEKIIEFMEYHLDDCAVDEDLDDSKEKINEELSDWDKNFINVEDNGLLFDMICGANYLDIKELIEVGAKYICDLIKGKTCQEVTDILNIQNDFTPEEEVAIREQNKWIKD